MTKTQMQACVTAATNAGFGATAIPSNNDPATATWTVRVTTPTFLITAAQANSLATTQGVSATMADVQLF